MFVRTEYTTRVINHFYIYWGVSSCVPITLTRCLCLCEIHFAAGVIHKHILHRYNRQRNAGVPARDTCTDVQQIRVVVPLPDLGVVAGHLTIPV